MWKFVIESGRFSSPEGDGELGKSGREEGENNPAFQNSFNIGPVPEGKYFIDAAIFPQDYMGERAFPLVPQEGTSTFGKSGFYLHRRLEENLLEHQCNRYHTCIILSDEMLRLVAASPDRILLVLGYERDSVE